MSLLKILGYLNLVIFLGFMLFSKGDKNKLFIKFILLSFPVLHIYVIPVLNTFLTGFDSITYIFAICFYKRRKVDFREGVVYSIGFVALIIIIITGFLLAESMGWAEVLTEFYSVFPIFLFAKILIEECIEDPSYYYKILSYLRITLVVSLIFLCCQFVLGVEFSLSKTQNPNIIISGGFRYPSFLSDPQVFAQYLAALSFICLIKEPDQERLPMKNYVLVILALVGILSSGARAGLLGWGLGLSLVVLMGNSAYRFTVVITGLALYLVAYNFQDSFAIFKRSGDLNETYDFRYAIWLDAFDIFLDHPFFGIGIGNYAHYVSIHNPDQFWVVDNEFVYFDHPESGYLKFLTELGGLGFIVIYSFVFGPMIKGFFAFLKTRDTRIILLIAAMVSWLVMFYSTYSFGDTRIKILIVTIICLLIVSSRKNEQEVDEIAEIEENAE